MQAQTPCQERLGRAPIGRILHPHRVLVVGQQLYAQVQGLLRAVGDDDLIGVDLGAAKNPQVVGHRTAQRTVAATGAVVQHVRVAHLPVFGLQPLPQFRWKCTEVTRSRCEWLHFQLFGAIAGGNHLATTRQAHPVAGAGRWFAVRAGLDPLLDEGAAADAAVQITLDGELFHGRDHGVA